MSVIVRADAGETPSMTQARAWEFITALSSSGGGNLTEAAAMALARRRVCEQYLGCRYDLGGVTAAAEWPAKDPRARARGGGAKNV